MDGVPVALMEAMACGRPVVTTALSGIPELVDDGVGWLIAPDNLSELRAALHEACEASVRQKRSDNARCRLVERGYTLSSQVAGLQAILRRISRN